MSSNQIFELVKLAELETRVSLIASENIPYPEVCLLNASPIMSRYGEGRVANRYYGGCGYLDDIEQLAIEAAKKLFGCAYANVQSYSGTIANFAIFKTLLKAGDKIFSLDLSSGAHFSHCSTSSFCGEYELHTFSSIGEIDMEQLSLEVLRIKPHLIICGGSSYPFPIDFSRFSELARSCGAYLFADIAHLCGPIVSKLHQSPFPWADVVMTTTHKHLRGPRGALILWNNPQLKFDRAVFPGIQGSPNFSTVAGIAFALEKASGPDFVRYTKRSIDNCVLFWETLARLVGSRDKLGHTPKLHFFLVNTLQLYGLRGLKAQELLEQVGIIVNKNQLPSDPHPFSNPSGVRLGFLFLTTLDYSQEQVVKLAQKFHNTLLSASL